MGEMAEYYTDIGEEWVERIIAEQEEQEIEDHIASLEKKYMMGVLFWETKDNGPINVSRMTKIHINNAVSHIGRGSLNKVSSKWIEIFGYEIQKRNS